MSYCRGYDKNHQIYMYGDVNGMFCCCGCPLLQGTKGKNHKDKLRYAEENSVWLSSRSAAILHLRHHRLVGHKFPRRAERLLLQELKEEGEYMVGQCKKSSDINDDFAFDSDHLFRACIRPEPKPWKKRTREQINAGRRNVRSITKAFQKLGIK